jgi:DNA polymerase
MMHANPPETRDLGALDAFEGALDWWREAGVDADFSDEASGWLAEPEAEQDVAAPPPPAPPPIARKTALERALEPDQAATPAVAMASIPDTLEKFREWWMSDPALAEGALERRVCPRGVTGAKLMLVVPQPFEDDSEGLLTGGAAPFVKAMLSALGVADHEAYFASALPAPMAMPDWTQLATGGLGSVLTAHIALAAPQRVVLFGRAQLTLLGRSPEDARNPLAIDCRGKPFPVLAAPDLRNLARSAARRETFWNRWLDWTR